MLLKKYTIKDSNGKNKKVRISNVKVDSSKKFPKNTSDGKYIEIRTGIHGNNATEKKEYEISYTINNAIEQLENVNRVHLNIEEDDQFWDSIVSEDGKSVRNIILEI